MLQTCNFLSWNLQNCNFSTKNFFSQNNFHKFITFSYKTMTFLFFVVKSKNLQICHFLTKISTFSLWHMNFHKIATFEHKTAASCPEMWTIVTCCSPQTFTEGITNQLIGCYVGSLQQPGVVLVRIYGRMTELYVDRRREVEMFQLFHAHGCGPQIYCSFQNGICYEFVTGTVLEDELLRQPSIYRSDLNFNFVRQLT